MKAGRELDALVAEKIMGERKYWVVLFGGSHYGRLYSRNDAEATARKIQGDFKASIIPYFDEPHYSTNIADAWSVVETVLTWKNGHVDLSIEADGVCCTISSYERDGQATALSVPLAICLAALNAVEKEEL